MTIVSGADDYLASEVLTDLRRRCRSRMPDAEPIDLDAAISDRYDFDEAVGASLLSDSSIVTITDLAAADEGLRDAMIVFCRESSSSSASCSVVLARHDGGVRGRRTVDALAKAGARLVKLPDLSRAEARLDFVLRRFEGRRRHVTPDAAQRLVAVLGDSTGELAAMCDQLCDDCPDDPIDAETISRYLIASPRTTGFMVADSAMQASTSQAVIALRQALAQGVDPIAIIGVLAMKLRTIGKAAAVRAGVISQAETRTNPWVMRMAARQLPGWTSEGLSRCIRMLAEADEHAKTGTGDAEYAVERAVAAITRRGREDRL
ncbi:DNA polymerase III subunit delta [uncultured Bifidobacterium sp.]|uniref:DNA polymerase III subunit delta n=1 Tax=uncultured Bifidobacterium sp. TaxID=165187 RepID=UPI0037DC5987